MSDSEKNSLSDEVLYKAVKSTLDDNMESLDDDVRQRLQQARRAAIRSATSTKGHTPKPTFHLNRMAAAGSFVVLALVTSVIVYTQWPAQDPSPLASIEDIPILTAPEELELYEELEFYQWLAEEHDGVG